MKNTKLYNVLFPLWLLIAIPFSWVVVLPVNFIVDSIVLLIVLKCFKTETLGKTYINTIFKVWVFGFASDVIGSLFLLCSMFFDFGRGFEEYVIDMIQSNPFDNIFSLMYVLFAVVVSGVLIYVLNRFFSFGKAFPDDNRKKRIAALALAIITAPYTFLLPTTVLYGGSAHNFTNHFVSDRLTRSAIYENYGKDEQNELFVSLNDSLDEKEKTTYLTILLRNALNNAKKSGNELEEYEYTVIFKDSASEEKSEPIGVTEKDGLYHFSFKGKDYVSSEKESKLIKEEFEVCIKAEEEIKNKPAETTDSEETQAEDVPTDFPAETAA